MSPEPFDSRAKAPPAKRWEKGYGNENELTVITEEFGHNFMLAYISIYGWDIPYMIYMDKTIWECALNVG